MWKEERFINIWIVAECLLARLIFLSVCFLGERRNKVKRKCLVKSMKVSCHSLGNSHLSLGRRIRNSTRLLQ